MSSPKTYTGIKAIQDRLGKRVVAITGFGSRMYGTSIPSSDWDYKGVMLPTANEILDSEQQSGFTERTNPSDGAKNGPDDVDIEFFSLYRFLELLMEGQTVAIDMLFAPEANLVEWNPLMERVWNMRGYWLNTRCGAAIGYAKSQAHKYSLRGDRIQALETITDWLRRFYQASPRMTLGEALDTYPQLIAELDPNIKPYVALTSQVAPTLASGVDEHLSVCGKEAGLMSSVKFAYELYTKRLNEYGDRARAARSAGGADWKAMYHALRIASQTVELLRTGWVSFPRPDAADLLKVRLGQVSVDEVSERIEQGIEYIREAQLCSVLRADPDRTAARLLIREVHLDIIRKGYP